MELQEAFDAGFEAVKAYVDAGFSTIEARLLVAEARAVKGDPGQDADPAFVEQLVFDAVAKIRVPEDGKSIDFAEVDALVKAEIDRQVAGIISEEVSKAVAAIPPPKDGKDGESVDPADVVALVAAEVSKAVENIPSPDNGADGVGLAGAVIARDGTLVVTLTDGTHRNLGGVVGNTGEPGRSVTAEDVAPMIAAEIERHVASLPKPEQIDKQEQCAPDDVAANVAAAIRMMAEMPAAQAPAEQRSINIYSSVSVPEIKSPTVNVTMPEQAAPVVNVGQPNIVIEAKRSKEVTKVTGYDKNGRITSFEKTEVE